MASVARAATGAEQRLRAVEADAPRGQEAVDRDGLPFARRDLHAAGDREAAGIVAFDDMPDLVLPRADQPNVARLVDHATMMPRRRTP